VRELVDRRRTALHSCGEIEPAHRARDAGEDGAVGAEAEEAASAGEGSGDAQGSARGKAQGSSLPPHWRRSRERKGDPASHLRSKP
jgi:hypothetical protein